MFDIVGPTTVHLQHEGFLLVSLTILTVAAFQSVYGGDFGTSSNHYYGDWIFCALTAVWLSRYIMTRWVCTWDTSTNANPTIRGVTAHWITSYILAGQYFDRPSPQLLAKQAGVGGDSRTLSLSTFSSSSLRCAWNLIRVRILFPFLKRQGSGGGGGGGQKDNNNNRLAGLLARDNNTQDDAGTTQHQQPQSFRRKKSEQDSSGSNNNSSGGSSVPGHISDLQKLLPYWNKLSPMIQVSIPAVTLIYYSWWLPFTHYFIPFAVGGGGGGGKGDGVLDDTKWFGAFQRMEQPSWSEVFFVISFPTLISLVFFTRLINPIPDLVAGSNVLKAVRNEAKAFGGVNSKSSKSSKVQKDNHESPWLEQTTSIVAQNRLKLIATVLLLRIVENVLVVLILPLSGYACRATGHCNSGLQLWQLSTLLFPVGITTPLRTDGHLRNDFDFATDYLSAILVAVSVIVVSGLLLLAQAVTLNGSYLAITGYICGEWAQVDPQQNNSLSSKNANNPSQYDPRRRYKKGDVIVVNGSFWFPRQVFYKATSNSPEGRPFDIFLRASYDMFRNELGHPATSRILTLAIQGHLMFIAVLIVLNLGSVLIRGNSSNGMFATLVANLVACYGAINTGLTRRSELHQLSKEVGL